MTREEAINTLRETHDNALFSVRTALETLTPEIKESKEEREADNETEVRKACDHNTGEKIPENNGWIITPHKEFFKWIYERLIHVHKENPNVDYMRSLKERINNMPSDEPQWKPTDSHLRFLRAVVNDPKNAGAESCHIALKSLLEELEKL